MREESNNRTTVGHYGHSTNKNNLTYNITQNDDKVYDVLWRGL